MATGTIKKLVRDRGFGFVQDDKGQDIFFHRTGVEETNFEALSEGESVQFDVERDPRGRGDRAIHVRPAH